MLRRLTLLVSFSCASCAATADGPTGETRSAVLGGRFAGAEDNATVLIEAKAPRDGGNTAFCTGQIVAPRLVLTARHCLLTDRSPLRCNSDGTPFNVTSGGPRAPLESVTVYVGARRPPGLETSPDFRAIKVEDVYTQEDFSVCRDDLAFLVLKEPALDVRTPFRRAAVRYDERVRFVGWGFTGDGQSELPETRSAIEGIPISELGPGTIPAGMFAIRGNTVCYGDSGGAARVSGAIVGVYSRIEPAESCTSPLARNVFQGVSTQTSLIARAFAAVGEVPTYVDDRPDAGTDAGTAGPPEDSPPPSSSCHVGVGPRGGTRRAPPGLLAAVAIIAVALGLRASRRS